MAKIAVDLRAHPMRQTCEAWLAKIKLALEVRNEKFGKYAEEISKFYDGPHDFMWKDAYASGPGGFIDKNANLPTFRVTINNVFAGIALFVPALYHKNPNILVSPILAANISPEALGIDPNDPYGMQQYQMLAMQEQQQARVKEACAAVKSQYINWVQAETDKKAHSRRAITEALLTGLGYLETTIFQPPASQIVMPRSTYVSWCDVVVDPDAAYWEDVQWIAILRRRPVNKTEDRFGAEQGTYKGHIQSFESQTTARGKKEAKQNRKGKSFDIIEYWEVFSKNGFGDKLADDGLDGGRVQKIQKYDYSMLGDYCWLAVAQDIPYPLNCPSEILLQEDAQEAMFDRVQWPVPFWQDQDGWPVSRLTFYDKENEVWPISLFKSSIGEIRFINWCMSFLADKVAATCTTYVGIMKSAGATIQKQLNGNNAPFTVIEVAEALGKNLNEIVTFLQAPNFPDAIWKMLAEVAQQIDKKTGVTELSHGMTPRSMRSATEASIKNERISVRPDDMASRTEDWLSEVAVREIQTARWFCEAKDVEPVLGQMGAIVWQNYVMSNDPDKVVRDFNYHVEAGSTRKPNKETKIAQLTELGQAAAGVIQGFAQQGMVEPYNAWITELAKAMDIDPAPFIVQLPEQNGPSPEEQQMQAEMALKEQEAQVDMQLAMAKLQMEMQKMQAELGMEQQAQDQELEHAKQMQAVELEQKKKEFTLKQAESKAKQQAMKTAARNKPKTGAK
jgi:hypothetical protein